MYWRGVWRKSIIRRCSLAIKRIFFFVGKKLFSREEHHKGLIHSTGMSVSMRAFRKYMGRGGWKKVRRPEIDFFEIAIFREKHAKVLYFPEMAYLSQNNDAIMVREGVLGWHPCDSSCCSGLVPACQSGRARGGLPKVPTHARSVCTQVPT